MKYHSKFSDFFCNLQDAEGEKIKLGVCASGIIVYKDKVQMNRFVWPKVLKMSYRRKKFYIKIRPGEVNFFIYDLPAV